MPDGHDEWECVNKDSKYSKIMSDYYDAHPTYNGECADSIRFEKMVRDSIYGKEEYEFNGGF